MANDTVLCTYRVRADDEERFRALLAGHWRLLDRLGFVTGRAPIVYRSVDELPRYVEIFTWRDHGFERAHQHPDVLRLSEAMDPLLEDRDGHPKWDFPHFSQVMLGA